MISPVSMANVSNVHFGDTADNRLSREGAYAKHASQEAAAPESSDEKKSSTGKKVAIGAVIVAAALAALAIMSRNNVLFKALNDTDLAAAKWYQPKTWGHYLNKAGNWIAKYTWDPLAKLFKRSESSSPSPAPSPAPAPAPAPAPTPGA